MKSTKNTKKFYFSDKKNKLKLKNTLFQKIAKD